MKTTVQAFLFALTIAAIYFVTDGEMVAVVCATIFFAAITMIPETEE